MTIGHWSSLTEAQKLTQSQLIPGVIEEDIKRNNLLDRIPVAQARGKTIKWLREATVIEDDISNADIGDQLSWSASVTYEEKEAELKRKYVQRVLDNFIPDVYGTINDYEAVMLWELKKGIVRRLGDDLIYDDLTFSAGNKEFDGLHALAALEVGTNLDLEPSGALTLAYMRLQHDEMKHGIDFCYLPYCIGRRFDEAYQEAGFAGLASASAGTMGVITYGVDDAGKRLAFFDGVPLMRTDFLVQETTDTGEGSDARAKNSSGGYYSLFHIKFGDVFNGEPGLCLGFGNTEMLGQFYKIEMFDKLENYDAQGIRLVTYLTPMLGSSLALGRIHDITDAAITA